MQTSELEKEITAPPEPDAVPQDEGMQFLDLLIILARRKRFVGLVATAITTIALLGSLAVSNRYTATASIMPPQQTPSASSMLMTQLAGSGLGSIAALAGGSLGLKNPNDLYIGLLKSRTIQDAIISKFGFVEIYGAKRLSDARKKLGEATNIRTGKDNLIAISFEDENPNRSADVANAYVDELRALTKSLAVTEASQRRLFYEQQLQQAKEDLANAEVGLKETQQKTGMIQLDSQSRAMIETVGRIRAQIAAKEVQLEAMGSYATDQNPQYVLTRQELVGLRAQLAKFESEQPGMQGDPLVATAKIPGVALEYVRRFREVKYRETMFELLAKQYEAAKLDEAKQAAIIQVVDRAIPPDIKSWPHRGIITAFALLSGLFAGSILAFSQEAFDHLRRNRCFSEQLTLLAYYMHPRQGKPRE